jgi:hypothetical protein
MHREGVVYFLILTEEEIWMVLLYVRLFGKNRDKRAQQIRTAVGLVEAIG